MTKQKSKKWKPPLDLPLPVVRRVTVKKLVPVHVIVYDCICWECGAPFTSKRPDARYDSHACRSKAYRRRQRERKAFIRMQHEAEGIFASPLY